MPSHVRVTWTKVTLTCICIFSVKAVSAVYLRRLDVKQYLDYSARAEAGFDLNEEEMIKFHIWPQGVIPYYIDDFSFDKVLRDRIRKYLSGVNDLTELHFKEIPSPPENDDTRWVLFVNRKGLLGCADHAFEKFTNEGVQKVVLGYDCMNSDQSLAEVVLSLVGVPPQHNAPDRDEHVEVRKKNIIPSKRYLFNKLKDNEWLFHNLTYDIESAGHYEPYKHTANGQATIPRIYPDKMITIFGPVNSPPKPKEKGFSLQDVLKIAMLYNYVLRNRETLIPECSKLFVSGDKPSNIAQHKNRKVKPRKKPYRYLGIKEEVEKDDDNESNDSEEINKKNSSKNNDNESIEDNKTYEEGNKYKEKLDGINDDGKSENSKNDDDNTDGFEDENYVESYENPSNEDTVLNANVESKSNDEETVNSKYIEEVDYNVGKNEVHKYEANETNYGADVNDKTMEKNGDNRKEVIKTEQVESNQNDGKDNKINEVENFTAALDTTPKQDRLLLTRKVNKFNKLLLGQSDYETADEGRNKYIHETR